MEKLFKLAMINLYRSSHFRLDVYLWWKNDANHASIDPFPKWVGFYGRHHTLDTIVHFTIDIKNFGEIAVKCEDFMFKSWFVWILTVKSR